MNHLENYGLTDRFRAQATLYPNFLIARIISQHKGLYKIATESEELQAEISGKLRHNTDELAKFPTVGDFVMVAHENPASNAIIHHTLTRKSLFLRTAVGVSHQAQSIAANIDIAFICMSLNNNFNLNRLERYLSIIWDSGATPVIILTKSDLCEDLPAYIAQAEQASSFSSVISLSMFDDNIEEKLKPYLLKGTTAAFIGSSGVGKSTIINKILGKQVLATSDVGKGDKGRHTTTGREMFPSPYGCVLIDTPGMRELGAEGVDLSKTFDDIEELATHCKFSNCTHTSEKGCAILAALENGSLDSRRFRSYQKLKNEVSYSGLTSKEIETKKWERFGGVKNLRKIGREHRKIKYK